MTAIGSPGDRTEGDKANLMDVDCWLQKKYFGNIKGALTRVIEARIGHSVCK